MIFISILLDGISRCLSTGVLHHANKNDLDTQPDRAALRTVGGKYTKSYDGRGVPSRTSSRTRVQSQENGKSAAGRRVQLHRALSKLGLCSRSLAWAAIKRGRVEVNNKTAADPLMWIDVEGDAVTIDGGQRRHKVHALFCP